MPQGIAHACQGENEKYKKPHSNHEYYCKVTLFLRSYQWYMGKKRNLRGNIRKMCTDRQYTSENIRYLFAGVEGLSKYIDKYAE